MTKDSSSTPPPNFENELIAGLAAQGNTQAGGAGEPIPMGPPLQARYPVNRLVLIPQGPFRVFAYWDLAPGFLKENLRRFPKRDRGGFQMVFRFFQTGEKPARWLDPGATLDWWFDSHPDQSYRAQLCLYSPEYGLHPVLDSNEVRTPPVAIRGRAAESGASPAVLPILRELAQKTGLPFQVDMTTSTVPGISTPSQSHQVSSISPSIREETLDRPLLEIPLPRPTSR